MGSSNPNDFLSKFIQGVAQLGYIPKVDEVFDMAPVDFVCQSILHICSLPSSVGLTFHLLNKSKSITVNQMGEYLRELGVSVQSIPYLEWKEILTSRAQSSQNNALFPILSYFKGLKFPTSGEYDDSNTKKALRTALQSNIIKTSNEQEKSEQRSVGSNLSHLIEHPSITKTIFRNYKYFLIDLQLRNS